MKTQILKLSLLCLVFVLIGASCEKDDTKIEYDELYGTWLEKNPELYDGISDTLVFTNANLVEKHFYFSGYSYKQGNDSLVFFNNTDRRSFSYDFISSNEIVINNFLDRKITSVSKNIHFQKLN